MRVATAYRVAQGNKVPDLEELSVLLDNELPNNIDLINWEDFNYKPEVKFAMAYSDVGLYLKYFVTEDYFKAEKTADNENVYEDSCVEFFVSPGVDGPYYNFEFNAIGTCLMGVGSGRADRKRVDPMVISKIRRLPSAGTKPFNEKSGTFSWTLTVAIPFGVFLHHKIEDLKGTSFRANFYKCGDKLTKPHYLTWNKIDTVKPDFHRPEFFGEVRFC